jgi:hypothetical protein
LGVALARKGRSATLDPDPSGDWPAYTLRDGAVWVSTTRDVSRDTLVRSYDVRDLTRAAWPDPADEDQAAPVPAGLFDPRQGFEGQPPAEEELVERLVEFLTTTVDLDIWLMNGGRAGSIVYFDGRLVVGQTWQNHRRLAGALRELRAPREPPAPAGAATATAKPARVLQWDPVRGEWEEPETPTLAALEKVAPEVRLEGVRFEDAVEWFRTESGANVVVDWVWVERERMRRDTPVTLNLRNVTLGNALSTMLRVNEAAARLAYELKGDLVVITTARNIENTLVDRIYDVRDLVAMDVGFGDPPLSPEERRDELEALGTMVVEAVGSPALPRGYERDVNWLKCWGGRLIIRQTRGKHDRITRMLEGLRAGGGRDNIPSDATPATETTFP